MNFCYNNISILFADDARSAQKHYSEYLGELFQTVYMADNGTTAWELYQTHRPDIVLLDIEMPTIDGLSLAGKIRKNDRHTRIIIASAHGDETRLLEAVELGLTRFLPKPFGRRDLTEALAKAVSEIDCALQVFLGQGFRWDTAKEILFFKNEPIRLTSREQSLLSLLASRPGQTFSPESIEMELWPETHIETDIVSRLKTLVKRLRQKLPSGCIENIYGEGYRLNPASL